jgi:hypothetical protein
VTRGVVNFAKKKTLECFHFELVTMELPYMLVPPVSRLHEWLKLRTLSGNSNSRSNTVAYTSSCQYTTNQFVKYVGHYSLSFVCEYLCEHNTALMTWMGLRGVPASDNNHIRKQRRVRLSHMTSMSGWASRAALARWRKGSRSIWQWRTNRRGCGF